MDHSIELDEYHRLSVAYRDLAKLPANFQGCAAQLVSLDASHNELSNLEVLENCTKLETLILDSNALSSSCGIPHLPSLRCPFALSHGELAMYWYCKVSNSVECLVADICVPHVPAPVDEVSWQEVRLHVD